VVSSYLLVRFPVIKNVVSTRPAVLINKGKPDRKAMLEARISVDELVGELRQQGICSLSEVQYAILEQNGKITVIQKAKYKTPTVEQMKIKAKETGISHIVVCEGKLNKNGIRAAGTCRHTIFEKLRKTGTPIGDVYIMTADDAGNYEIVKKEKCQ